jgi:uncharacterized membrane protein
MALAGLLASCWTMQGLAAEPVVRAVLFYSPTCPHCQKVMTEDLPPLIQRYGQQLQIAGFDVTGEQGSALYRAAVAVFEIPTQRLGVPTLITGGVVLVGSVEIPERLPGLIEELLAGGGTEWPEIPGLVEALAAAMPPDEPAQEQAEPGGETTALQPAGSDSPGAATGQSAPSAEPEIGSPGPTHPLAELGSRVGRDPLGNGLAIVVLLGMLAAVVQVVDGISRGRRARLPAWGTWAAPALILVGLAVAGYLAFVELTQTNAVCGPVGDCNTVHQSQYSRLLGWIPIGVLGVFGYVLIGMAWAVSRYGPSRAARLSTRALLGLTLGGTLFSVYLTFLEPFVIGATCAWCLASAVITTLLMLLSARMPAAAA